MRLTNAPGSRSRRSCREVSHRPVADGLSCAIWPRSPPVFGAHVSDRTRFVTTGVGQRSDTEEKEVGSKNDHDHESQFLLATFPDGGHPPRLLSITVRESAWGQRQDPVVASQRQLDPRKLKVRWLAQSVPQCQYRTSLPRG